MRPFLLFSALFLFLIPIAVLFSTTADPPQRGGALPSAATIVKPRAYVSLAPVPRGQKFEVAVVAEIHAGFHMNSHQPTDEYLIPTTLMTQWPQGLRQIDAVYPPGEMRKFSFSPKPLSVYTGRVTLTLRIEASANAPLGAHTIPLMLRYQACNETTCLPPVKIPVDVTLLIAAAGTRARATNPEIFSTKGNPAKK
jgi:Thiol:disulfide interchange protein DsbD, N-terminal